MRSLGRSFAMMAWTVGMAQSALWHLRLEETAKRRSLRESWVKSWAGGLLQVFGIRALWHSPAETADEYPRLVVANHRSPIDILLMLQHFGGSVVARHDLEQWPILGWAARSFDTIFVDRNDPKSGIRAIREMRRRFEEGKTVILFPEGTTYRGDEVRTFQAGAFIAAQRGGVKVVPAGIAYQPGCEFFDETFEQHIARVAQRPVTHVAVSVGKPHEVYTNSALLAAEMQSVVQGLVNHGRAQLTEAGQAAAPGRRE